MSFLEFKDRMFDMACFNINQVLAWKQDFDRNNITRWAKKGYIVRLKQGYYAFPEYKKKPEFTFYFANRIYKPSYISLHTALSFYGMIPEAIIQVTSVSSLKTISFKNDFGEYSYNCVKDSLMFGYDFKQMADNRTIQFASPEKALLDLLYLYPFYDNESELENLRLDENYLHEDLNKELLNEYSTRFQSKALDNRVKVLFKVYDI